MYVLVIANSHLAVERWRVERGMPEREWGTGRRNRGWDRGCVLTAHWHGYSPERTVLGFADDYHEIEGIENVLAVIRERGYRCYDAWKMNGEPESWPTGGQDVHSGTVELL